MSRAWGAGFLLLVIVDSLVVLTSLIEFHPRTLMLLMQISPFVAALVSSFLSPRRKVLMGMSMAIPTAILGVLVTCAYQLFNRPVNFPGIEGGLIVFVISFLYGTVLCAMGGTVGYIVSIKILKRK